jgi:hypothetical protein
LLLVPSIIKVFALLLVLLVAACSPAGQMPTSATAVVGTKTVIKYNSYKLVGEITDVSGKLVTTEFTNWEGQFIYARTEYRGLFPVSGTENGGNQWELDFDESKLEALFPLEKGKSVSFKANFKNISKGTSYDIWAQLEVRGEKTLDLPDGKRKVLLVELNHQSRRGGQIKNITEFIYYDAAYSMALKKVTRDRRGQSFWRVISIERPGNISDAPQRQRRSGTVMI